jgi:signal transduction histidine kinase
MTIWPPAAQPGDGLTATGGGVPARSERAPARSEEAPARSEEAPARSEEAPARPAEGDPALLAGTPAAAGGGDLPAGGAWPPRLAGLVRRLGRLRHRDAPDAIDYAIAAGCFAAFTLPVLAGAASRIGSPLAVTIFGVLAAAPLIVRRRWPLASVAMVTAVYLAATLAGVRFTPFVSNAGPNLVIAVFTAADRCGRRASLTAAIAAALVTWAVLPLGISLHPGQDQDAVQLLAVIPAWVAGDMVRVRRGYRQRLEQESRHRAADREARARAEERLRLSRDVHDVVSHSLSTIAVRSGVARLLLDEQPEEARAALTAIESASRSALDELRQILRQTRDPAAADETATPAIGDLPALIGRLRRSGLDISYQSDGPARRYGTALELSAYRIAQEALTNVMKHAPGARAQVRLEHGPERLTITVTDDGPGPAHPAAAPAGFGLTGMRERVAMLGGTLTAQGRPEGGFAVVARLPARRRSADGAGADGAGADGAGADGAGADGAGGGAGDE